MAYDLWLMARDERDKRDKRDKKQVNGVEKLLMECFFCVLYSKNKNIALH